MIMRGIYIIAAAIAASTVLFFAAKQIQLFGKPGDNSFLQAEGVWLSRGYGWLWSVESGNVQEYDYTGTLCLKHDDSTAPDSISGQIRLSDDAQSFRIALFDPTYFFTFDRLPSLPKSCTEEVRTDPVAVFQAAGEFYSKHYAFFPQRGVDWPAQLAKFDGQISSDMSDEDLFSMLSRLIAPIDDAHVTLSGDYKYFEPDSKPRAVPALAQERQKKIGYWTRGIEAELISGQTYHAADGDILFGLIQDDVGYIRVQSTSSDLAKAARRGLGRARELFQDTKALIIDLTGNDGGLDSAARQFASLFTTESTIGYYKYAGDVDGDEPQAVYVEPGENLLYTGPIYLITDIETISAAEIMVMCLRALPNVTHIGEATRGSLSDNLNKELPNGWALSLSNEIYLDSERNAWEGKGIAPQLEFVIKDGDRTSGKDKDAALGMIGFLLNQHPKS